MAEPLVPADFALPEPPDHPRFRFAVLGPEHNAADLEAWSSSIVHIRTTPGFGPGGWPERPYTLEENRADLEEHREHHERHLDFAWTVLDPERPGTVIGCVYLKPPGPKPPDLTPQPGGNPQPGGTLDAVARSWVRADRAELDRPLRDHLRPWFADAWPLRIRYDG